MMLKKGISLVIALLMSVHFLPVANDNLEQMTTNPGNAGGLANSPWPMFRQNPNHTGLSPYDTSGNPGKLKWSSLRHGAMMSSPAIGSDGTIYVGDAEGKLYAFNPDGTEKWNFMTNNGILSSPAIGHDGTVYFYSKDRNFYAINSDGSKKWSFDGRDISYSSPAIGFDGTIYVGSYGEKFYAINPDGSEKWSSEVRYTVHSSPAIGYDGTIYVGSAEGILYAINPDGTEKWNFTTGNWIYSSPAIGIDGTIYFGSWDNKVYAINPDGSEKWSFTTGGGVSSSPAIGSDGTIYIGSNDSKYYAINPDGTEKWNFSTGARIFLSSPAISSEGTIYVGSMDKFVYALYPNGTMKWSFEAGAEIHSSPSIGSDGTIYVSCMDGKLYAIGTPSNQSPVADAGPDQTVNEGDTVQFNGSGSYDPDSRDGAWINKSNIPTQRVAAAGSVLDNELYVIGGGTTWMGYTNLTNTVMKYNPKTDSWSSETPIFEPHSYMGASTVNGKLYAMGGLAKEQSQTTNLEFDPITHTWTNKSSMPYPRQNFAVAVVDNKIYAIGGSNNMILCPTLNRVDVYDPVTDNWTRKADMPSPREGLAAAVYDNKIYAIGGFAICPGDIYNKSIVEVYDPATDTWTSANSLPTGRFGLRAETLGNKIYTIGGWNKSMVIPEAADATDTNEVYDPLTDSWTTGTPMWETRARFVSGVIDNRIYVVAGHSKGIWAPAPKWSEEFGLEDELQYSWDFDANVDSDGDGDYTNDKDATGQTPTHVYYDNDVYTVTLTVTDSQGLQDTDQCIITVLNVPPVPEWTSRSADGTILNPPYPEGKEILFTATVYDPGIYDTFTYDWDFGDGTLLLDAGPSVTHTYGDNDTYIVVLKVTDDDKGVGIDDTPPLPTTNENPVVSIIMPFCIFVEGTSPCEPIGQFTDPGWLDTHAGVWDYGDGTYQTAVLKEENDPPDATGWNVTSHIYGDNGIYNLTFTVADDDGGLGSDWADAQVQNLPPSLTIDKPISVNEGENFILRIDATDPGSDDIIIDIDWGDGSSDTKTYYNNGIGPDPPNSGEGVYPFTVQANFTHVYGDNGDFTVVVTATDDDAASVQNTARIKVMNLPPEIAVPMIPLVFDEGDNFSLSIKAKDPGSDDLHFTWTLELGPSFSATYYNDGMSPDPPLSPWGTYPFIIEDTINYAYGDNGFFNVIIVVEDDDGGENSVNFTVEIKNKDPVVQMGGSYVGQENSPIEFASNAIDPGSDDLTFVWDWGDGTIDTVTFYNDGIGMDPPKSPWGTYPFSANYSTSHIWGDNGDFNVTLTVMDDDGGIAVQQTLVTVHNVNPTIEKIDYYLNASFSFRIAGEKWHNVEIYLFEGVQEIGYANITRYPGSPNDQMVVLADTSLDLSKTYSAIAYYTPEDDPVNGQIQGATPAWIIIGFDDGEERIHHTFNVNHNDTWIWGIEDFSSYFLGHNITFVATASDPGSDDLTFVWDWGEGNSTHHTYYNNGMSPDPYPSPEVNPMIIICNEKHSYDLAGTYTIKLTVIDDDGGSVTHTFTIKIG